MKILITSPSLNSDQNISGISSVVKFIIDTNNKLQYIHFELGRRDDEKRNAARLIRIMLSYFRWFGMLTSSKDIMVHFNIAMCRLSIIRDFPLILMARILRKRMIIHLHGGDYLMQKKQPRWMEFLWNISLKGKNPVIVLSSPEEAILRKRIEGRRIHTLPNCISLKEACSFNRNYSGDGTIMLLFLGRISVDKGIEFIYRALKSLKMKNVKFKFILAGRGPDETDYARRFNELLGDDFEFNGVVTGNQKTEVLKKCNVFILPSFYEGLPVALLESMSFGLVPVTTNVGSIDQVVTDGVNGMFVRSHSSLDIESAIEKLSKEKEFRHELSRNAKQFIFNKFDPSAYVNKLNEIYNYE